MKAHFGEIGKPGGIERLRLGRLGLRSEWYPDQKTSPLPDYINPSARSLVTTPAGDFQRSMV